MTPFTNGHEEMRPAASKDPAKSASQPFQAQLQWWQDSGSLLARMLQAAQYSTHQQYQHLLFFHRYIIPFFGPYPHRWFCIMTKSGIPIEYSLNFQQSGNPVIRLAFEPVSEMSGTPDDPFNKKPSEGLVAAATRHQLKGFDPAVFDHFSDTLFIADAEVASIPNPESYPIKTHTALGFDFKGDKTVVKGYLHPRWKSIATGIPVRTLLQESITKIKDRLDCWDAFTVVDSYMHESNSYDLRNFIAWDCTSVQTSRLKIYGIHNEVSLSKIEELWTLGGRLTDGIALEGLKHIRRLWGLLDIDQTPRQYSAGDEEHLDFGPDDRFLPLFWNYEIASGSQRVSPKIYFPVYGENDLKVALALSRFFQTLDWNDKANSYIDSLRGLYPGLDISQTSRLQVLISFAFSQEKGVYMSVYYHSTTSYPSPVRAE
ncbi:aromatic prenyltransferase [Aspergillus varians]